MVVESLINRLAKNYKHRRAWAKQERVTAFRVYDLDMPEWPLAVDCYAGAWQVTLYPRRKQLKTGVEELATQARDACVKALGASPNDVFVKKHEPKAWGDIAFERQPGPQRVVTAQEDGLSFECNLTDYLDAGLFLDHRNTRRRVRREARDLRFLNLFAYTGSFTIHALSGGARETTTVDLSKTYCDWAGRNFALNGYSASSTHRIVRDDVLEFLVHDRRQYDLIVVDPPSFSASKKMNRRFEVQRDHRWLIERCLERLSLSGSLYFSNNYQSFVLDSELRPAEELTPQSTPADFRQQTHRCWRFAR